MESPHDPNDIVPEGFVEAWDADTIPEALRRAEEAPSTTPREERPRCPECGGTRIRRKSDTSRSNAKPGAWKCIESSCKAHFDTPDDPRPDREGERGGRPRATDDAEADDLPEADREAVTTTLYENNGSYALTVPKPIAESLGLEVGDELAITSREGGLLAAPMPSPDDVLRGGTDD